MTHALRIVFIAAFVSLFVHRSHASTEGWKPFFENGKWGYKNKSGEVVIKPVLDYEFCYDFSNGMAAVYSRNSFGYINSSGIEVIRTMYSAVTSFYEGRAVVQRTMNGKCWFIDKEGRKVLNKEFDDAWGFYDSIALVKSGELWYYIDYNGNTLFGRGFKYALQFQDGLAVVKEGDADGYSYINKQGVTAFAGQYRSALSFHKGKAVVKHEGRYMIIDKTGTLLDTFPYRPVLNAYTGQGVLGWFEQGVALVQDTVAEQYFFINEKYERMSRKFLDAFPFDGDPYAPVEELHGGIHYVDSATTIVVHESYIDAGKWTAPFSWVKSGDDSLWYTLDENLNERATAGIRFFPEFHFGLARVQFPPDTMKWFINRKGEKVFGPYKWTYSFSDTAGLAPVHDTDDALYFIDPFGNHLGQQEKWTSISTFRYGYAMVGDSTGAWFVDSAMHNDFQKVFEDVWGFNDSGYAPVRMNGLWGLINHRGEIVVNYQFKTEKEVPKTPALYVPPPVVVETPPEVQPPVKQKRERRPKRGAETLTAPTFCFEAGMVFPADKKFNSEISGTYYFAKPEYAAPLSTGQMDGGLGPYFSESEYIPLNGINKHMRVRRFDWGMNAGFDVGAMIYNLEYCADFYSDTTTLGYDVAESLTGNYWLFGLKCGPNLSFRPSLNRKIWFEIGCVGKVMGRIGVASSYGTDGNGYERNVNVKMDKGMSNRFSFCNEYYFAIRLKKFRIYGGWVMNLYDRANYTETWTDNGDVVNTLNFKANVNLSYVKVGLGMNISDKM